MICINSKFPCLYAETVINTQINNDYRYIPTPKIVLPYYNCVKTSCFECEHKKNCEIHKLTENSIFNNCSVFCKFHNKNIRKFITLCEYYQNKTLDWINPHPEFLQNKPEFECKICNGNGFVNVKISNQIQKLGTSERFDRDAGRFAFFYRDRCFLGGEHHRKKNGGC